MSDDNRSTGPQGYPDQSERQVARREEEYRPEEDTISLLDLIAVLAKRKWLIIGTTALAAVAILTYSIISLVLPTEESPLPNYYKAEAFVLINDTQQSSISAAISGSGLGNLANLAGVGGGGGSYGQLAMRLLESRSLLDQLVEEFNIIEEHDWEEHIRTRSRNFIKNKATFELESGTGILSIAVEDTDPEFAYAVANRMTELLEERFATIGVSRTQSRADLLEEKLIEVEERISVLEQRIKEFQQEYGTFNVQDIVQEQVQMRARLRSDLLLKDIEISTYTEFTRINDPALQRLRAERESLRQLLQDMEQGTDQFDQVLLSQQELPELAIRFARMERDLEVQSEIYRTLTQQYELARLSLQGEERTFQVLEEAEVPDIKAGPSRAQISIITTITAFFLSVFLAFVLEYFSRVKDDPEEGEKLKKIKSYLSLRRRRSR